MWREARMNDKKIKSLMTGHRKRAEKKRDFYEKIRRDPAEFLQVHGRPVKIHIDLAVSSAAESCLVGWRGDTSNMIDRFDARAHLDVIPDSGSSTSKPPDPGNEETNRLNYERWKNLVHHDFKGNSEEKVLQLIRLEEGRETSSLTYKGKSTPVVKKKPENYAAISFSYDQPDQPNQSSNRSRSSSSSSSDSEPDLEDGEGIKEVDVTSLSMADIVKLKTSAQKHNIPNDDFIKFLDEDREEEERIRVSKEIENEKSMFAGRKSRRERKAIKDKRMLIVRTTSVCNPASSVQDKPAQEEQESSSSSESEDDTRRGKTEFITSFGGSSEDEDKKSPKDVRRDHCKTTDTFGRKSTRDSSRDRSSRRHQRHRSRSRSRDRRRRSRSRSRKRSRRSRSRSRSRDRHNKSSKRRTRSRSRDRRKKSSSPLTDEFGRSIKSKPTDVIEEKAIDSIPLPEEKLVEDVQTTVEPPPPVKRYYRHDLAKESDDDSSSNEDKDERIQPQPGLAKQSAPDKVTPAAQPKQLSSGSKNMGRIHRLLLKKSRAEIESHYRQDKRLEQEREKMEQRERSRHNERSNDSDGRPSSSSRHRYEYSRSRRRSSSSS